MENRYFLILLIIVTGYLLMGAAIFHTLEQEKEAELRSDIKLYMDKFLDAHPFVNMSSLEGFLKMSSERCDVTKRMMTDDTDTVWDFMGSLMFVGTVVTTIGYGHLAPVSDIGKMVCVIYALFGIPLTLLLLNEVSKKLHGLSLRISRVNFCCNRPRANRLSSCLLIFSLSILIMFVVPTAMFSVVEGWSFIEGLYFCFITLSTIGFGDYIPCVYTPANKKAWWFSLYKLLLFSWILFGLAYLALVIRYLMQVLAEYIYPIEDLSTEAVEKEIEKLYEKIENCRERLLECKDKLHCEEGESKKNRFMVSILRVLFVQQKIRSETSRPEPPNSKSGKPLTSQSPAASIEMT